MESKKERIEQGQYIQMPPAFIKGAKTLDTVSIKPVKTYVEHNSQHGPEVQQAGGFHHAEGKGNGQ
ncbi:hypothetical protein D3C76_1799890 [compost metagenome]